MKLSSNGMALAFSPELFAPLSPATHLLADSAALRKRLFADGYLYLPGVLDRAEVLRLRGDYFSLFEPGILAEGTTPEQGVFSGSLPPDLPEYGVAGHPAYDFVRSAVFERFVGNPLLARIAETLLGGAVEMLPRRILRHFHRGSGRASRAHVDLDYMDAGSPRVVTMWIPVGDCPPRTGSLVYLEGSHTLSSEEYAPLRETGDRSSDRRAISHDLELTARDLGRRWLWADFAAGDVMIHVPRIIHASLDTRTDAMRLSADVRFVRTGDTHDPRWLTPWSADDGA
ncbi:phytanoyl-CoA dioxygenase [Streptomyces sp. 150FB]|uniref:phytanoyl-CoA dioxygenase family protein n=1 Tax=Streptomyces sp. 150FB TaxID=1576605 RepID=UPI00058936A4|nr:phytanoyl-CoA dioxygenase family protein [Streptomyces sp. 150FB]KIF75040.1 phytanoyl-CoA dioxygenase [Streptomyces sp. 150FB]